MLALAALLSAASFQAALAQTAPPLGAAESFGVLGASTVTNTGATVVTGNLGVSPGTSVTGFPPGVVSGQIYTGASSAAGPAQADAAIAFNDLVGQTCDTDLTGLILGTDPGATTLSPGVYCFDTTAQLTGTLTLNGGANDVWVFQIGTALTTASTSAVVMSGGGQETNVFWAIGTSATLGTGTEFVGDILADASITLNTGATVSGRVIALTGAVTLDGNANVGTGPDPFFTAPGPGPGLGAHIRGFRFDSGAPGGVVATATNFLAYPVGVELGAHVATGDVDGDGALDIITGPGPGPGFTAHVKGFLLDGTPIPGLSFLAYPSGVRFGVKVACGDLDGDGKDEIITGPGPGKGLGAHVRAFTYDPVTDQVTDFGVSFLAYSGVDRGVNVAAADLDGDGSAEIITGPGPGKGLGAHVRAFSYAPGQPGDVVDTGVSFLAYPGVGFGVNVAAGDLDGDGSAEIITGPGPGDGLSAHVRAFSFAPGQPGEVTDTGVSFLAYPLGVDRGVNVTAADLDGDGSAEIITGPGPWGGFSAHVRAFSFAPGQPGNVVDAGVSFLAYPGVGFGVSFGGGGLGQE